MVFLNILLIIARISVGLNIIGFILGICLSKKYKIFEEILAGTGFCVLCWGFMQMLMFVILG